MIDLCNLYFCNYVYISGLSVSRKLGHFVLLMMKIISFQVKHIFLIFKIKNLRKIAIKVIMIIYDTIIPDASQIKVPWITCYVDGFLPRLSNLPIYFKNDFIFGFSNNYCCYFLKKIISIIIKFHSCYCI